MDFENPKISRELALLIQDIPFEQRATFRAFAQKTSSMKAFKKMIADGFFGSAAAL
jgi:hypothetical protein